MSLFKILKISNISIKETESSPFKNNVKSVETHKGKRACMQELDAMHHAANISAPVKH